MKNRIRPFIKRLIRENIAYIFGNIFILVLIVITLKTGLTENFNFNNKDSVLKSELNQLRNKISLIQSAVPSSEKLDEDINFLNALIPNAEDYFSIIYSLERLSAKSNFIVTSYSVNVTKSTPQKLKLSVTGSGDSQSFISFLKEYSFSGGRLITSDSIQLDPNFVGSIKIDLTFYNKKVSDSKNFDLAVNEKIFEELEVLKSKVNFTFNESSASNSPDLSYPKKSNFF